MTASIKIATTVGQREIPAEVFGGWAVHRQNGDPTSATWVITQLSCGLSIPPSQTELLSKRQAIKACKEIDALYGGRSIIERNGKVSKANVEKILVIIHRALTGQVPS